MPKPTKHQKRAGSPKLQLGLGKGILKQSTLLDTPKKKTAPAAKPPPATAMDTSDDDNDDDNGWPKLPTATPMDTQGTPPDNTTPHIVDSTTIQTAAADKDSIKTKQAHVTPTSETPPVRKSVGFGASNMVVEESLDDNGDSIIAVRKQLAPVFANTSKRKTTLFIKVKLPVESKPMDPTSAARTKLKELGEILQQQDPSVILYKYKQMAKDEKDACTKLSQIPTTITGIQSYMNGFRPSLEGGDVWGSLRIGINEKAADFLENASQEANMRKFWLRKAPLQAAETEYAGWLYLSHEGMHPEDTADSVNAFIKHNCEKKGRIPFVIACERRMIWDDKSAKSKDLTIKEKQAKKALHFVCEKGNVDDATEFIRAWLKSDRFTKSCNVPMKFVPNFSRGSGSVYNAKFGRAVQKHMQLTAFGTRHTVCSEFENVDSRCSLLTGNPSLRKLILAMQTRPRPTPPAGSKQKPHIPGPVFLSVDAAIRHSDRGCFVVGYTVDNAVEAEEKLKNLLSYLIHEHGESATYWFNTNAISQADSMKWDNETDRPITVEEMDLDLLLDDDVDWTANMDAADITFKPIQIEVNLVRPSLLHRVSNNPLNGEVDSVQTFHQGVSNLPSNMDGDDSANRAAVIGDDSDAGDLEGSPAPAV